MIRPSSYHKDRWGEKIQENRVHTVQLEQEQELQLPEQQLQEQGDMLMVGCLDGLNHGNIG